MYDGGNGRWPAQNSTAAVDWSTEFHTFTVEWTGTTIGWFVDGVLRHARAEGEPADLFVPKWPFYMILNTAMNPWTTSTDHGLPALHTIDRVTWCQKAP